MKVLLTDDSATIRMILKGLLKQLQITDIAEAADGQMALQTIKCDTIDLVLLDIHMPKMDGLSCLKQIKSDPQTASLPIIMVTSDTDESQIEQARALGAHAYIKKPFRIEGLREALQNAVPEWSARG